jgi:hypothetical protein
MPKKQAMATPVELKAEAVRYFSQSDEAALFEWLAKLPCISSVRGESNTLYICVIKSKVDEGALRELLALFHRYKIDMRQLRVLDKVAFASWFHNRQAYWYESVFDR